MNQSVQAIVEPSISNENKIPKITWKSFLLFFTSLIGVSFVLGIFAGVYQGVSGKNVVETIFSGYLGLLIDAAIFVLVLFAFKSIRTFVLEGFTFQPFKKLITYGYLLGSFLVLFASQYLFIEILKIDDISAQSQNFAVGQAKESILQSILLFASIVVITPIKEEILYRGILHRFFADRYHFLLGFFLSSIIFGLLHIGYPFSAIVMGMVFVGLYRLTKSLTVPIISHMIWNLWAIGILFVS